jgi:hypothetical protein
MIDAITVDGEVIEFKTATLSFTNNLARPAPKMPIPHGGYDISGTLTCYFENAALLRSYYEGDVIMQRYVREMLEKPHKAAVWNRAIGFVLNIARWSLLSSAAIMLPRRGAF